MQPYSTMGTAELLVRTQSALGMTQEQLGELMGASRRSIIRWQQQGTILLASTCATLARATYPCDRELAVILAARGGHTLESLGLEQPPAPPAPLPAAAPMAAPRPFPAAKHLADSVVCAAAEAMQSTPQAMRPALIAAFERVLALGMKVEDALQAMTPEKPGTQEKPARPTKQEKAAR